MLWCSLGFGLSKAGFRVYGGIYLPGMWVGFKIAAPLRYILSTLRHLISRSTKTLNFGNYPCADVLILMLVYRLGCPAAEQPSLLIGTMVR